MAQASETVPVRRIPKQPECNIGTSGHVDHGKCAEISQEVLVDGVPTTGVQLLERAKASASLIARIDGGELYSFDHLGVVSITEDFEPAIAKCLFYVEHYSGPLYAVKGKTGRELKVTPEHPLLINRNGVVQWIKAKDIVEGDHAAFLGRVPLSESLVLPDVLALMREGHNVVTSEDSERIRSLSSDFTDYSQLGTGEIDKARILARMSNSELARRAKINRDLYTSKVRAGEPLPLRVRKRVGRTLASASIKELETGELVVERNDVRGRRITAIRDWTSVDADLVKWFAFVWSEGSSSDGSIMVTQTAQRRMLREYVRITEDKLGLRAKEYPGGRCSIYNTSFVDYIRLKFGFNPGNESVCGIADWVCKLPQDLKAVFLRWFLTLDGEFDSHNGRVSVSQLNERNVTILSYLLHSFGIVPKFNVKRSKTKNGTKAYWRLTLSGRRDLKIFADQIGFEDDRIQRRLLVYLSSIEKENDETDMSIPVDATSLRSLLKVIGLTREGFDRSNFDRIIKETPWYRAYSDATRSGRLSRTNLRLMVGAIDDHLNLVEESASGLRLDGSALRHHAALVGISLAGLAGEMGYSRKKLVRIFRNGSKRELWKVRSFLLAETRRIMTSALTEVEGLRRLASSQLEFDRIVSVKKQGYDGLVFDLSVPGYANFIAGKGATVCHNTSLVAAITGVWASAHSEELKRGITIKVGYADAAFYKCAHTPPPEAYSTSPVCPVCGQETQLLRAVSFVDSPGHESLMTNMLAGAAVMDGAILVIAANEPVPMPQTREHMLALQMLGMKKMVIVQNKIDRVDVEGARKNYEAIKSFLSGTVAADAPIVPVSAQHHINIDALIEAIEEKIPTPQRDSSADAQMVVLRSFDVNKPGTEIASLVGGVLGGSVVRGELKVGDEVEISPGMADDRGRYIPLITKVASLGTGVGMAEKVGPGGLVSLGTTLDPSLTKGDMMVGSLVGKPGSLPAAKTHFTADLQLFDQAVGSSEMLKVEKVRPGESLRLNIGTAATLGTVTSARESIAEVDLRKPVVAEKGSRVAISRRIAERWRLIGSGLVK